MNARVRNRPSASHTFSPTPAPRVHYVLRVCPPTGPRNHVESCGSDKRTKKIASPVAIEDPSVERRAFTHSRSGSMGAHESESQHPSTYFHPFVRIARCCFAPRRIEYWSSRLPIVCTASFVYFARSASDTYRCNVSRQRTTRLPAYCFILRTMGTSWTYKYTVSSTGV